jgi:hypothetical protein
MINWRQIFGYRTEPEPEFHVGDRVYILSKSIGCNMEEFEDAKGEEDYWTIDSINHVGSVKWERAKKRSSGFDGPVYVIAGNWFIAEDLELRHD